MTKKMIIATLVVVAGVTAGVVYLMFTPKADESAGPKWQTAVVSSQHIVQSITATGTVEPVTTVDIGTQVSGTITSLYVDYNSVVKEGEVIAELDKSTLLLDYNSNKNNLDIARSEYEYQLSNYTRIHTLHQKSLIADSEYESALYSYEKAKNDYEVAKNNLARSQTNLGYATIYSPIDGVVLSRSVEVGQTVASSFSTPTLFTVAADLTDMRVIADVDEADIGNVREGQKATFQVDAFPLDTFEGVITQVRLEAIVESNVVTYEVVISAANPDLKLKPGLTANVEIFTLDAECDAVVPAAALSFTPPTPADMPPPSERGEGRGRGRMMEGDKVWVLRDGRIRPQSVTVGVSNGILTEIVGVEPQDSVVIGMEATGMPMGGGPGGMQQGTTNPFAPKRPGQRK